MRRHAVIENLLTPSTRLHEPSRLGLAWKTERCWRQCESPATCFKSSLWQASCFKLLAATSQPGQRGLQRSSPGRPCSCSCCQFSRWSGRTWSEIYLASAAEASAPTVRSCTVFGSITAIPAPFPAWGHVSDRHTSAYPLTANFKMIMFLDSQKYSWHLSFIQPF